MGRLIANENNSETQETGLTSTENNLWETLLLNYLLSDQTSL